jgi:hypothetical protein
MDRLCLARDVFDEIARTVGTTGPGHGGALGWREDERVVRYFKSDGATPRTGATASPDDRSLEAIVMREWNPRGIRLAGFVRSHARALARPQSRDLAYAKHILAKIPDLPHLVLLIVSTEPGSGEFSLVPYIVRRDGEDVAARRVELDVLDGVITVAREIVASQDSHP